MEAVAANTMPAHTVATRDQPWVTATVILNQLAMAARHGSVSETGMLRSEVVKTKPEPDVFPEATSAKHSDVFDVVTRGPCGGGMRVLGIPKEA